ncbi:MAG: DUF4274 domain-containing protein [Defluviitaleaceae bacterium]|nr:DUF4274 domain-containing protein [Defluviitaleaceae bacterium]
MLTNERKQELRKLAEWVSPADDHYYFHMTQKLFDTSMSVHTNPDLHTTQEYYKAYCLQREIGFDAFKEEATSKMAVITCPKELHFLADGHNYDGGMWFLEQIMMNPACDIITAKMVYWLCQPDYYYSQYGSPQNCPDSDINRKTAHFLVRLEAKANSEGFSTGLVLDVPPYDEQPPNLDFTTEPYSRVPDAFR